MKQACYWMVLLSAILVGVPDRGAAADLSPREIYQRASPAVVMIMGHSNTGRKGSGGTGSIIRSDGLVLTNAHVVLEPDSARPYARVTVYLKPEHVSGDSRKDLSQGGKARILAFSQELDLAVLQLEPVSRPFPVLSLDDSDPVQIGDRVVAIGHPEEGGLWALTTGTISAVFENFRGTKGKAVFQTETGLNRGNSGGPLLDAQGRMIGINTAIARVASDGLPITSISFSLKSNVAKQWLREQGVSAVPSATALPPVKQPVGSGEPKPVPPAAEGPLAPAPNVASPHPSPMPEARPYDLDRLVTERERAEADLEGMMQEMRKKFRSR